MSRDSSHPTFLISPRRWRLYRLCKIQSNQLVQLRDVARREKSIREAELKSRKKEDIYHGERYIRNYTAIESISFRSALNGWSNPFIGGGPIDDNVE